MKGQSLTFTGPLAEDFREFAALMRSTGAHHATTLAVVGRLDRFLIRAHPEATALTKDVLRAWFDSFQGLKGTAQRRYRSATFQLCKFLYTRHPATATLEDFEPLRRSRSFKPYILSIEEISTLLGAAARLAPRPSDPLRPLRMKLILGLLYSAGLRMGEVVRLRTHDYDAQSASLTIRETKFAKSRMIPLSCSARKLVEEYLERRRAVGLAWEEGASLLCGPSGRPPCLGSIQAALVKLMRRCGIKPASGRQGPRIHDTRHSFAVHRVLQWYREGKDVQALLPLLVTYMGHRGLESTQLYLSITPDVLHEASARFRHFAGIERIPKEVQR